MPNSASARKRLRQSEVRNLRNRGVKSELKTHIKRVLSAVESGNADAARKELSDAYSKFDKAAKKGVLHKNTADRRKAFLSRRVLSLG